MGKKGYFELGKLTSRQLGGLNVIYLKTCRVEWVVICAIILLFGNPIFFVT